jgi:hypothetical protein
MGIAEFVYFPAQIIGIGVGENGKILVHEHTVSALAKLKFFDIFNGFIDIRIYGNYAINHSRRAFQDFGSGYHNGAGLRVKIGRRCGNKAVLSYGGSIPGLSLGFIIPRQRHTVTVVIFIPEIPVKSRESRYLVGGIIKLFGYFVHKSGKFFMGLVIVQAALKGNRDGKDTYFRVPKVRVYHIIGGAEEFLGICYDLLSHNTGGKEVTDQNHQQKGEKNEQELLIVLVKYPL